MTLFIYVFCLLKNKPYFQKNARPEEQKCKQSDSSAVRLKLKLSQRTLIPGQAIQDQSENIWSDET